MSKIKLIVFDLGETLLNYGSVNVGELFTQGAELTYQYLKEHYSNQVKLPSLSSYRRDHILSIRWNVLKSNITLKEFDCMQLLKRKLVKSGLQPSATLLHELCWLWYEPLSRCAQIEPDLSDTFKQLQEMSFKLAILSNTFLPASVLDRHLDQFGILSFFDHRFYTSETVYRKPDRRVFQKVLEECGVQPGQAVMVGDRKGADVKGALRVGMTPVYKRGLVNQGKDVDNSIASIDHIRELPELLRNVV